MTLSPSQSYVCILCKNLDLKIRTVQLQADRVFKFVLKYVAVEVGRSGRCEVEVQFNTFQVIEWFSFAFKSSPASELDFAFNIEFASDFNFKLGFKLELNPQQNWMTKSIFESRLRSEFSSKSESKRSNSKWKKVLKSKCSKCSECSKCSKCSECSDSEVFEVVKVFGRFEVEVLPLVVPAPIFNPSPHKKIHH